MDVEVRHAAHEIFAVPRGTTLIFAHLVYVILIPSLESAKNRQGSRTAASRHSPKPQARANRFIGEKFILVYFVRGWIVGVVTQVVCCATHPLRMGVKVMVLSRKMLEDKPKAAGWHLCQASPLTFGWLARRCHKNSLAVSHTRQHI